MTWEGCRVYKRLSRFLQSDPVGVTLDRRDPGGPRVRRTPEIDRIERHRWAIRTAERMLDTQRPPSADAAARGFDGIVAFVFSMFDAVHASHRPETYPGAWIDDWPLLRSALRVAGRLARYHDNYVIDALERIEWRAHRTFAPPAVRPPSPRTSAKKRKRRRTKRGRDAAIEPGARPVVITVAPPRPRPA